MTSEERFTEMFLRNRKGRPWGALNPHPLSVITDNPLGNPTEKSDPSKYRQVAEILGIEKFPSLPKDPELGFRSLADLVKQFDPTWEGLEFLKDVLFSELQNLKQLISVVDPFPLTTMDQKAIILYFNHCDLTNKEKEVLGEHTVTGAVDYVEGGFKEIDLEDGSKLTVPGTKSYFVDRNIIRAYQRLYSPWIIFWLYGYAAGLAPRGFFPTWSPKERFSHSIELMGVRAQRNGWPIDLSGKAALSVLQSHKLFVEDSIWFSVLSSRQIEEGQKPSKAIFSLLAELSALAKEFDGRSIFLHPATVSLMQDAVPRGVISALVELTDPELYQKGVADRAAMNRLDALTDTIATAWRQHADQPEVRSKLGNILISTPNIRHQLRSMLSKNQNMLSRGQDRAVHRQEIESEQHIAFLHALEDWDPSSREVSFSQFLQGVVRNHVSSKYLRKERVKQRREHPIVYETDDEGMLAISGYNPSSNELPSHQLDESEEMSILEQQVDSQLPGITTMQARVLQACQKYRAQGHKENDVRDLAAKELGITRGNLRRHLSDLKGRLLD